MNSNKLFTFILLLSLLTQQVVAGPWACAACITTTSATCIASCASLLVPQLILACSLECEVAAAYGVCAAICAAPTP
jgi:hypothetical protein